MPKANEIVKKINDSLPELEKLAYDAELLAAQKANELLFARTFASNDGVHDSKNAKLKGYSKAYAKKRENAGRQTKNKDLQFTGALFESVQVGIESNKPALGFLTQRSAEIAGFQEEQNNTKIFVLNQNEIDEVKKDVVEFTMKRLSEIVKSWY